MKGFLFIILFAFLSLAYGQDLTVDEEILNELETVVIETETDTITLRVAYPDQYDKNKEYSCLLGLSGGNQTKKIVNYCYAAWFRSGYFNDYMTILPVVERDTIQFDDYPPERIENMLSAINEHFRLKEKWLIAGTSNGGDAAFQFVNVAPDRFEGIITAPGTITASVEPTSEWSHLKVVLCYGELDAKKWIQDVKLTHKTLKKIVSQIKLIKLEGQGHILPVSFNADKMYDPYFLDW
jgi:predicted esterase